MKRTPFYRRPGRTGQFSGLRERVIWMIQTRGRPVTGSEIAEKFGVTLIEFNRVANGITRGTGQIAQIVESEKWLNEDGICDLTFDLVTKPKVVTPQGKSRLFTRLRHPSCENGGRMTPETDNAIRAACRRCTEEIQQAMRKKPKPNWNETVPPIINKHHKKIEALGVSLLEFVVYTGRLNRRFGVEQ